MTYAEARALARTGKALFSPSQDGTLLYMLDGRLANNFIFVPRLHSEPLQTRTVDLPKITDWELSGITLENDL